MPRTFPGLDEYVDEQLALGTAAFVIVEHAIKRFGCAAPTVRKRIKQRLEIPATELEPAERDEPEVVPGLASPPTWAERELIDSKTGEVVRAAEKYATTIRELDGGSGRRAFVDEVSRIAGAAFDRVERVVTGKLQTAIAGVLDAVCATLEESVDASRPAGATRHVDVELRAHSPLVDFDEHRVSEVLALDHPRPRDQPRPRPAHALDAMKPTAPRCDHCGHTFGIHSSNLSRLNADGMFIDSERRGCLFHNGDEGVKRGVCDCPGYHVASDDTATPNDRAPVAPGGAMRPGLLVSLGRSPFRGNHGLAPVERLDARRDDEPAPRSGRAPELGMRPRERVASVVAAAEPTPRVEVDECAGLWSGPGELPKTSASFERVEGGNGNLDEVHFVETPPPSETDIHDED